MKKELPFYVRNALKTKRKLRNAERGQSQAKQPPARLGYSIEEFAELTGVSRSSVYKALRSGCLTARKIGKRTIISAEDAEKYLHRLPFWTRLAPNHPGEWDC
jgi:excisionase family DNA binding protein